MTKGDEAANFINQKLFQCKNSGLNFI